MRQRIKKRWKIFWGVGNIFAVIALDELRRGY